MLLFDAPEAASPPREDPFHCGSVCVFELLIQDSRCLVQLAPLWIADCLVQLIPDPFTS